MRGLCGQFYKIHHRIRLNGQILRYQHSTPNKMKVTIVGASGSTGQSLSLLLKQSPLIDELCLYDTEPLMGFAKDLSYVDTKCTVTGHCGNDNMPKAVQNSLIVVVLSASPQADQLQSTTLFDRNAPIVRDIMHTVALYCPKAFVAIATNPINSLVPMAQEIFVKHGICNPVIFGVTTLDVVRANKFVAEVQGLDPEEVCVPVIGGNTENTIIPVLSQAKPCSEFSNEELEDITNRIRKAHSHVLKIKLCESATLSRAFALARFTISIIKAIRGSNNMIECAYVKSTVHPQLKYMATPLLLGPGGIMKNLGIPDLSDFEACLMDNAAGILMDEIQRGECYVQDQEIPKRQEPKKNPCPPEKCDLEMAVHD